MQKTTNNEWQPLEQGTIVLSLDAELRWGHFDVSEKRFKSRYPNAMAAYDHVLRSLCSAGVSATWLVVGGMALEGSSGPADARLAGLPAEWTHRIPRANEMTAPLWYQRSFIRRLASASVKQDIGLHGGLTHMLWSDSPPTQSMLRAELEAGLVALRELGIRPSAFSFPHNMERHHALLAEAGIRCYRGAPPIVSAKWASTLPASLLRFLNEMGSSSPAAVCPRERLPGLWNIPASLVLYPMGERRIAGHESRLARVQKGIDAAVRDRAVFHLSLHPLHLAESRRGGGSHAGGSRGAGSRGAGNGYALFDSILEQLVRVREKGTANVLTMTELAGRMDALTEPADIRSKSASSLPHQVIA